MKVLVTGATGFIGQHLINDLLNHNLEVIATSSNIEKAESCSWYSKVKFKTYELGEFPEEENLYKYFEKPDILIHLAWKGLPNYMSLSHIDDNLFTQFYFLKNLIKNGLRDITITGTCLEYGMQSGSLHEGFLSVPSCTYALAKDCLRRLISEMQREYSFDLKWVRLFYIYGQGQNPNSLLPLLEKAIKNNDGEFYMSGGEQLRDFLPVDEVVRIIGLIAGQKVITGIINCCSGKPISVRRLVEEYVVAKKSPIKLNLGYFPYPDYEPMAFWGDKNKLDKILGMQ